MTTDTAAAVKCTVSGGTATLTGADGAFTVYSISGAVQHSGTIDCGQASFDTAGWAHGIYIVRDAAGNTAKFKV